MRLLTAAVIVTFFSGCSTVVPVKPKFPEAVPELVQQCRDLEMIVSTGNPVSITDMLKTIVNNYSLYYQCSNRVDGWNKWYQEQRKIYESVK